MERETSVATELTYGEEIRRGLSDTIYDIGQGLRDCSIWFIVNLPFLLIWAVIIAVIVLIVRRILKVRAKKQQRRQAALGTSQKTSDAVWTSAAARTEEEKASEKDGENK